MTKQHQSMHPFLAQIMFRYIGPTMMECQGVNHKQLQRPGVSPVSKWELRLFQNPERIVDLYKQGVGRDTIAQRVWDEMCQVQDTIGVILHKQMFVCDACATAVIQEYGGIEAAFLAITTAMVTRGCVLLVTDRLTEKAAIVGNVPGTIS